MVRTEFFFVQVPSLLVEPQGRGEFSAGPQIGADRISQGEREITALADSFARPVQRRLAGLAGLPVVAEFPQGLAENQLGAEDIGCVGTGSPPHCATTSSASDRQAARSPERRNPARLGRPCGPRDPGSAPAPPPARAQRHQLAVKTPPVDIAGILLQRGSQQGVDLLVGTHPAPWRPAHHARAPEQAGVSDRRHPFRPDRTGQAHAGPWPARWGRRSPPSPAPTVGAPGTGHAGSPPGRRRRSSASARGPAVPPAAPTNGTPPRRRHGHRT